MYNIYITTLLQTRKIKIQPISKQSIDQCQPNYQTAHKLNLKQYPHPNSKPTVNIITPSQTINIKTREHPHSKTQFNQNQNTNSQRKQQTNRKFFQQTPKRKNSTQTTIKTTKQTNPSTQKQAGTKRNSKQIKRKFTTIQSKQHY